MISGEKPGTIRAVVRDVVGGAVVVSGEVTPGGVVVSPEMPP